MIKASDVIEQQILRQRRLEADLRAAVDAKLKTYIHGQPCIIFPPEGTPEEVLFAIRQEYERDGEWGVSISRSSKPNEYDIGMSFVATPEAVSAGTARAKAHLDV